MTNWKQELDALIESTMAFARDVKRQPIPDLPVAMRTAEQALVDTPNPVDQAATIAPIVRPTSERDAIRQRVDNFKTHQEKIAREREDYYLQVKAKMLAPVDPNPASIQGKNRRREPGALHLSSSAATSLRDDLSPPSNSPSRAENGQ